MREELLEGDYYECNYKCFSPNLVPLAVPQNINGQEMNATAIWVSWDPIPSTRESMMGKVKGYQVSYLFIYLQYYDNDDFTLHFQMTMNTT